MLHQVCGITFLTCLLWLVNCWGGLYEPQALWEKRILNICFFDESTDLQRVRKDPNYKYTFATHTQDQKILIEEILKANYNFADTGIEFSGFKNCRETAEIDVVIMKADETKINGIASMGDASKYSYLERRPMRSKTFSYIAIKYLTPYILAHEAGHVLGLYHEHDHKEASLDPRCLLIYKNGVVVRNLGFSRMGGGLLASAVAHTKYDPNSVMSYCNPGVGDDENHGRLQMRVLSDLDRKTLKDLYSSLPDQNLTAPNELQPR